MIIIPPRFSMCWWSSRPNFLITFYKRITPTAIFEPFHLGVEITPDATFFFQGNYSLDVDQFSHVKVTYQ